MSTNSRSSKLILRDIILFGLLGALMFASKFLMQVLPNIHLLGMMITAVTVVYRSRALYPVYVYVLLEGVFGGFAVWWIPYLYIWTVLWGMVMLLPKELPKKAAPFIYAAVCALHGFLFGTLYAPAQALLFGMSLKGMWAWILAGLPFDLIHGISNLICGFLILPFVKLLRMADRIH